MWDWVSGLDYGDVPTWVSAVATVGAFIAAAIAVRASWGVLQIERETRDTRHETRDADARRSAQAHRAEQADLVAAWLKPHGPNIVLVRNASTLPVYDFVVELLDAEEVLIAQAPPRVVPPTLTEPEEVFLMWEIDAGDRDRRPSLLRIEFTDAAGRHWARGPQGGLDRRDTICN